jgi:hypothetical protein
VKTARLVALALAAGTAAATMTATPALAAPAPKIHYIGSCQASGGYPICTISARTAYDVRHIWIRVRGTITIPGGGPGRIEASTDNLCEQGTGSGDDSNDFKAFPAYTRRLSQAYASPSDCYASAVISPVNYEGHGALSAYMFYTRRDGR